MKSIVQEDPMGCGIACTAFVLNKSYQGTKKLFDNPNHATSRGYYCREIVRVLNDNGKNYSFNKVNERNEKLLKNYNVIVFIEGEDYPLGHYLVNSKKGWMNPWIDYPNIAPAKSGFEKELPGRAQWIIYPLD